MHVAPCSNCGSSDLRVTTLTQPAISGQIYFRARVVCSISRNSTLSSLQLRTYALLRPSRGR